MIKKKKKKNNNNDNKRIVALKKWVSVRVILFCMKCFRWEIYFYIVILKFCPYLDIDCKGILEQKKKKSGPNRGSPLNNSIDM